MPGSIPCGGVDVRPEGPHSHSTLLMSKIVKKLEWLVLIYDKPVNQRLKFRAQHLAKLPENIRSGVVTSAGPMFKDDARTEFLGSCFTVRAESRAAVLEFLKLDIYADHDVWDFDLVVIHPYVPATREKHDFVAPK